MQNANLVVHSEVKLRSSNIFCILGHVQVAENNVWAWTRTLNFTIHFLSLSLFFFFFFLTLFYYHYFPALGNLLAHSKEEDKFGVAVQHQSLPTVLCALIECLAANEDYLKAISANVSLKGKNKNTRIKTIKLKKKRKGKEKGNKKKINLEWLCNTNLFQRYFAPLSSASPQTKIISKLYLPTYP